MKLCRLIEWFKGPSSAVDSTALPNEILELEGIIHDLSKELERKEAAILSLKQLLLIARAKSERFEGQRDKLMERRAKLENDWPAIHDQYFIKTRKRKKA